MLNPMSSSSPCGSMSKIILVTLLAALAASQQVGKPQVDNCLTQTIENPIWQQFPQNVTGIMNQTIAFVPIPYSMARSIIPADYKILTDAYMSLIPNFTDMYPAIFRSMWDHDIRFGNTILPVDPTVEGAHSPGQANNTFSFQHASISWPFVDFLGDNSTCFTWAPDTFESGGAISAITGTEAYGQVVYEAEFNPACDSYATVPGGYSVNATNGTSACFASIWRDSTDLSGFDMLVKLFNNVTNQPSFANGSVCDNQIIAFGADPGSTFSAKPVTGSLLFRTPLLPEGLAGEDLCGIQITTPFIENNYLVCSSLKGYGGTHALSGFMTGTRPRSGST